MSPLPLLRHRDPLAALLACAALIAIVAGPPRNVIRMKDASHPITISLATPPEEAAPAPPEPPPPRHVSPPPRPVAQPRAPAPRPAEPAPVAQPTTPETMAAPASQAAPAIPSPPAPPAPPQPSRPAPLPSPPAPSPASVEAAYVAKLRAYLESIKRYPTTREARSMRPQGRVRVWLQIDRGGALRDAGIEETSGSMILDNAALATVRQGTYPPFPEATWSTQSSHRFELTLEYTLAG